MMSSEHREIAVIGGGGHAKVVVSCLTAAGFRIAGLFDDDPEKIGTTILGYEVDGSTEHLSELRSIKAVIAVGSNRSRMRLAKSLDVEWVTVVHPAAIVDHSSSISPGSVVFAGAVLQAEATIGSHVIVNTSASIDHDCRIGDFAHIAPGARLAGDVTCGEGVLIGIGATLAPGVSVGDWAVIGAGSVVLEDVDARTTVAGNPARRIQTGEAR